MIVEMYRRLIPNGVRSLLYRVLLGSVLRFIRSYQRDQLNGKLSVKILDYYSGNKEFSKELKDAAGWIKKNGFSIFPANFIFQYKNKKVEVYFCNESGLRYIMHNGKRLYFPRKISKTGCMRYYIGLLLEQDIDSPHRYDYSCFNQGYHLTLIDLGAAEGIFTLSVIDVVEKAYLFECDEFWLEALQWTFKPYMNKVEIVNKYISNKDEGAEITVDTFMKGKKYTDCYIKLDIEGAEGKALVGANDLLQNNHRTFISACAYHLDKAGDEIYNILEKKEFTCTYTSGVMAFGIEPPYFRKGVIYARKR